MSASNSGSGDSMEWGRGRSRKGKRGGGGGSGSDKPRQPQRGLGVAQLEKIRIQSEMAEYSLHHPLGHPPPPIHRTGSFNLEDSRLSHSLPSSPSSSAFYAANIGVSSSSYPIHRPTHHIAMTYGERSGDMRYGEFQTNPIIRSPNYHGAIYGSEAHYSHPSNATLPLFNPQESICLNRPYDLNQTADSSNLDDQEVDLELKL
ncbi:hypothetical protein BDA96_09G242000 [Sorghum bicolor]|uniref:Uncharacterized protein n=2 Tax=Sorghum bicolor TaxID=4558 RepID=A0A921U555_SORBI|nr:protein SPEAR3 [Sorghum bicolor]EES19934.1 hypothetical protein SORBI_3009G229000 [Sorghum bicolor]KAG0519177.1 hypothetical protein BDA96_09G242000 [Sorghum bicolor]|eukprot:XP_002441504.1 protein SPEAR3 [Sorghum bicolor]